MMKYLFQSERLGFRLWSDTDKDPFHRMNCDPEVMRYFPAPLSQAESNSLYDRIIKHFEVHGYGLYAVEILSSGSFAGFTGFMRPSFEASFTPCVEIGWRLVSEYWNRGLATEAANRCLKYASQELKLLEVFSFTSVKNVPSERVMQKIGMEKKGEFDHPNLKDGDPLQRHVLYRIDLTD